MKKRTRPWFIATRGSYLPCSPAGWAMYAGFAAALIVTGSAAVALQAPAVVRVSVLMLAWWSFTLIMTRFARAKS